MFSLDERYFNVIEELSDEQKVSEEQSSSDESSEYTLLTAPIQVENKKRPEKNSFYSDNADNCLANIKLSDSRICLHLQFPYPAVENPGIEEALFGTDSSDTYPSDDQELYLHLCTEMNECPVRSFHKNLLSSEIDLSYYGLAPMAIRPMAMALQHNNFVTRFDLTDNFLNDDNCYHLGRMLKTNNTLKELILTGCRIGASGLLRLGSNFHFNCCLRTLKLDRNNVGDQGGVIFANLLSSAYVKEVNLSKNGMGQETASAFVEGLEWRNPLTLLDLSWNDFSNISSSTKMFNQVANSEFLQELYLSFTSLVGEHVAGALCNVLKIPELRVLDLSHNLFQGEAIQLFTDEIIHAKKLETLNLSYNPMSPQDAYICLRKMLSPKVTLQNLLMDNVCVNKSFLVVLDKVSKLKFREKFVVTHGEVLKNWTVKGPDLRILLLKRACFLSKRHRRRRTDIALYFLKLNKEYKEPVPTKLLLDRMLANRVTLNETFVNELADAFAGPPTRRSSTIDLHLLCEWIQRIWPDKKLPPTPPPEPEPEPEPVPLRQPQKSKKKRKKSKF